MTRLIYLEDPSATECQTTLLSLRREEERWAGMVDASPFYPKGGGAPSDTGWLIGPSGRMRVSLVLASDGVVRHLGEVVDGALQEGEQITALIDADARLRNSRIHSGGEVICAAVHELGKCWAVTAASHIPGQSRVAFQCDLAPGDVADFVAALHAQVADIVERDEPVLTFLDVSEEEVLRLCTLEGDALEGKKGGIRLVSPVRGFFRPCMGVHVERTGQIGTVQFRKTRLRDCELSIGYDVH